MYRTYTLNFWDNRWTFIDLEINNKLLEIDNKIYEQVSYLKIFKSSYMNDH